MALDWSATVTLTRHDSIVLTLPGNQTQLQQTSRHAAFTLTVDRRGAVTLRLDSMELVPYPERASIPMVGTVWTGRTVGNRVVWEATAGAGPVIENLSADIADFFPRLPAGGVSPSTRWSDTSTSRGRVDIFEVSQHVTAKWVASAERVIDGKPGLVVTEVRLLEQTGKGEDGSMAMSMTGQGSGSMTYHLLKNGEISSVARQDSLAVLISVPATHQLVPTVRFIRSRVVFSPITRGSTP